MSNRDRAYYRKMRAKAIKRKRAIADSVYHGGWTSVDGYLSKGKIHCSCGMCMDKTRNKSRRKVSGNYAPSINYKHADLMRIEHCNQEIEDYMQLYAKLP